MYRQNCDVHGHRNAHIKHIIWRRKSQTKNQQNHYHKQSKGKLLAACWRPAVSSAFDPSRDDCFTLADGLVKPAVKLNLKTDPS